MNAPAFVRRAGVRALVALVAGAVLSLSAPAARAMTIERVVSPGGIEAWLVRDRTLPLIASFLAEKTGNIYAGLYWVVGVALMTFLVGTFGLNESHRVEIWREAEEARPA